MLALPSCSDGESSAKADWSLFRQGNNCPSQTVAASRCSNSSLAKSYWMLNVNAYSGAFGGQKRCSCHSATGVRFKFGLICPYKLFHALYYYYDSNSKKAGVADAMGLDQSHWGIRGFLIIAVGIIHW